MLEHIAVKPSVVVDHAVVCPSDPEGVRVRVINPTPDIATVYNGTMIAVLEPIEDVMTVAPIQQTDTSLRNSEDCIQVVEECQYYCLWSVSSGSKS